MNYIKLDWTHLSADKPTTFYIELDENRYETRKVVVYLSGKMLYIDEVDFTKDVFLSEHPFPSHEEISTSDTLNSVDIPKCDFEQLWKKAIEQSVLADVADKEQKLRVREHRAFKGRVEIMGFNEERGRFRCHTKHSAMQGDNGRVRAARSGRKPMVASKKKTNC
ncbi:DUF6881 domain-containing protein [Vibrio splendidus]|uniref:DUF6881 domain-containing protein n=1 Tax=Vibrio splendidus TaxID=29497 RepID=UPI000C8601B5|nr:hypothetical protein [Vibrio splendidus]PMI30620.1 hypothetical protein BCU48_09130 [Vibrio splendidus]